MKNYLSLSIFLFISLTCSAQLSKKEEYERKIAEACGGIDSLMARKGSWKKVEDDIVFPDKTFPRSQYQLINARADSIHSLIKEAVPNLNAVEPRWQRGIRGDAYFPGGPVPYRSTAYFLQYYCNAPSKKLVLGDETWNWVYVFVNHLNWFLYEADTLDINDDGKTKTIFQLPPKAGKLKGMTIYKLRETQSSNSWAVIIGRNEKVPWRSITQKQYLTGLKNQYEKKLKKSRPGTSSEKDYTNKLKHIYDYLAVTDTQTLQQPVIIDPQSGIWGFKGKFGDEDAGGYRLVLFTVSDKYFDKNLPRHVPQLIQLYWSHDHSLVSRHFKTQFEENFPLEKLKAMIR